MQLGADETVQVGIGTWIRRQSELRARAADVLEVGGWSLMPGIYTAAPAAQAARLCLLGPPATLGFMSALLPIEAVGLRGYGPHGRGRDRLCGPEGVRRLPPNAPARPPPCG
jgi:hypothetical protein